MAFPSDPAPLLPGSLRARLEAWLLSMLGYAVLALCAAGAASLLTWSVADPSFTRATDTPVRNLLGPVGAGVADLVMRLFGLAGVFLILPPTFWALQLIPRRRRDGARFKQGLASVAVLLLAASASSLPRVGAWPIPYGLGGFLGDQTLRLLSALTAAAGPQRATAAAGIAAFVGGMLLLMASLGLSPGDLKVLWQDRRRSGSHFLKWTWHLLGGLFERDVVRSPVRREPTLDMPSDGRGRDGVATWRAGPAFEREARLAPRSLKDDNARFLEPANEGEFDRVTERDMARRFAPETPEPDAAPGPYRFRRRGTERPGSASREQRGLDRRPSGAHRSKPAPKPIWPGSVPVPVSRDVPPRDRHAPDRKEGDALYSRAVTIVCAGRKTSADFLQQQLGIGYMRAADLIERMEREGILGAPIRNGTRPILGRRRPRVV